MIPVEVAQIIARMLISFEATYLKSGPVESEESFLRSRRSQGRPQSAICSVRICRFICNSIGTRRASGQRAAGSSGFAVEPTGFADESPGFAVDEELFSLVGTETGTRYAGGNGFQPPVI